MKPTLCILGAWVVVATAAGALGQVAQPQGPAPTGAPNSTTHPTTGPSAAAPTSQPAKVNPEVAKLIGQLTNEAWRKRQAAQEGLVMMGMKATQPLKEAMARTSDEELRTRASAALRMIEENRVCGPSFITMHYHNRPPQEICADLAQQAQCELPPYPSKMWEQETWPSISIDADNQSFWTVLQDLSAKTGLQLQQVGGDRRMYLLRNGGAGNWMDGPSQASGPFLVVAKQIFRSTMVDLTQPKNIQRQFNINIWFFPEPKLRVLQGAYAVRLFEAVDDKGNSLIARDMSNDGFMNAGSFPYQLNGRLTYPAANAGHTITSLKGVANFVVQTRSEIVEVNDIMNAKNLTKLIGGTRRLLIKDAHATGGMYQVNLVLYRDAMNDQEWQRLRFNNLPVELVDADGRRLSSRGWGSSGSDQEVELNLQFSRDSFDGDDAHRPGEPVKLVWEIPLESKDLDVPFEFHDLPMPD